MTINVDFELLRTLVAFADTGSFKLASQLVFRSQPAVSMQMKRLERLTGRTLFERQGRDVALTKVGVQTVLHARKILAAHDRMLHEIRGEDVQGEVRIGMPDDYAPLVLPHILHQFSSCYSGVSLDILANTTPVLEEKLKAGELDIAILATSSPHESDVLLSKQPIVWVASRSHDAHIHRPLILALFADESPIYRATIASLESFATDDGEALDFRIGVVSKSSAVLIAVASSGFAVATMAQCVVPDHLRILRRGDGFPDPGHVQIVLRRSPNYQATAASLLTEGVIDNIAAASLDSGP